MSNNEIEDRLGRIEDELGIEDEPDVEPLYLAATDGREKTKCFPLSDVDVESAGPTWVNDYVVTNPPNRTRWFFSEYEIVTESEVPADD